MNFNEVIKAVLSPVLEEYRFSISDERKGRILFGHDALSISTTYDYAFSKDLSLAIYYQLNSDEELCIEDHELVLILGITSQKKSQCLKRKKSMILHSFMLIYLEIMESTYLQRGEY